MDVVGGFSFRSSSLMISILDKEASNLRLDSLDLDVVGFSFSHFFLLARD